MRLVELHLVVLVTDLMGDDEQLGLALTADEGFASLLRIARKMCYLRLGGSPETLEVALGWLKAAEACQTKRNRVAHALWVADDDSGLLSEELVITAKKGPLITETRRLTTQDLSVATTEMLQCLGAFDETLRPALRRTHPDIARRLDQRLG